MHRLRVCQLLLKRPEISETFLTAVPARLGADVTVVQGYVPETGGAPVLSASAGARAIRKLRRLLAGEPWDIEITRSYETALRQCAAEVALAEFGPTGVRALLACRNLKVPLVVRFHGYDMSVRTLLAEFEEAYKELFRHAAGLVAVSRPMADRLIAMGAPSERVHQIPCGVDVSEFRVDSGPNVRGPAVLAVGRFVEKKAPHLTILAFHDATRQAPAARLRLIGDGPLRDACVQLVHALRIDDRVTFLGAQPHDVVRKEMSEARVFVQHSVTAPNGDSEGLPVSLLEAGAIGLPLISTRHAGIPEIIADGVNGFLVDEHDIGEMSARIRSLLESPDLARQLGRQARDTVVQKFSVELTMARLLAVLGAAAAGRPAR